MTRMFVLLAAMTAFTLGGCASSDQKLASDDPNAEVCKRLDETGTTLSKRVCMTRAEWAALEEQTNEGARSFLDRSQRNAGGLPDRSPGGVN
ncbi:MAG: hypothetical protein VYC38_09115 [Pseudomonadota bacterium]|nr:hypothetical protein [Pseudomonadota bacterium]